MSETSSDTGCSPCPNEMEPDSVAPDCGQARAHLPFWEPGCGHYGNTLGQDGRAVIDNCKDLILSFVDTMPEQNSKVFTVGDYGTNDGYSSMHLVECIIRQVKKKRGDTFPVQVIYEDQEKNDFNSLFNRLSDETSYLSMLPHVYAMATNTGFYKQCVPDDTCDIIFTSMTTHWMESLDATFKDCVFSTSLSPDDTDTNRRVRQAADRDWTNFLLHRTRELKPGGLLVVLTLSAFDDFRNASSEKTPPSSELKGKGDEPVYKELVGGNDVHRDLETAWRRLRDENKITQDEYERCVSPLEYRTAREITSPFETVPSLVRDAGLSLVHHDQVVYPFFAKELWRDKLRQDGTDDRKFFARIMTSAHQVWSDTTFRESLSSMRTAEEKSAIVDELYTSFETNLLAVNPNDYNTDYIVSRLVARKL